MNFRVHPFLCQHPIQPLDFFDYQPLDALADALRVSHIMDSIALGLELHPLEPSRQETTGPLPRVRKMSSSYQLEKHGQPAVIDAISSELLLYS